uniref:Uncharacterized protein n=1 Tax=viral metagenome TaxID=1070528 RepID=A0A6C0IHH2_9ZZZZ
MSKTDEFNTLYNLLANLSAKKVKPITSASTEASTAPNAAPNAAAIEIQNTIENTDTVENEVIDNIVPFIKQKRTYTRRKPTHSDADKEPPILEKEGMQCKSCLLSVLSEGALIVHYDRSPLCRKWAFLPDEMQEPVPVKTVYQVAMEYVRQSITADKELTCKFCKNSFTSLEQHHAHYQTTIICNRMAHLEFKRILKSI